MASSYYQPLIGRGLQGSSLHPHAPQKLWLPKYGEQTDGRIVLQCKENNYFRLRDGVGPADNTEAAGVVEFTQASSACAVDCDSIATSPFRTSITDAGGKTLDCTMMFPSGSAGNPDDDTGTDMTLPQELYQNAGLYGDLFTRYMVESVDYVFDLANWGDSDLTFGCTIGMGSARVNPNDVVQGQDQGLQPDLAVGFKSVTLDHLKYYPLTVMKTVKGVTRRLVKASREANHMDCNFGKLRITVPVLKLLNQLTQKMSGSNADLDSHSGTYSASPGAPSSDSVRLWIWVAPTHYSLADFNGTLVDTDNHHNTMKQTRWHQSDASQVASWTTQCAIRPSARATVRLYDPVITEPAVDAPDIFPDTA